MKIVEIFNSIDGEGKRAGQLATFIRTAGCNLHCGYCDTPYAQKAETGTEMTISDILKELEREEPPKRITLTGGEPLLQRDAVGLIKALAEAGYEVNIETNGSISLNPADLPPNVFLTADYKTPGSGCNSAMQDSYFKKLRPEDVLKIVIVNDADLIDAFEFLLRVKPVSMIYLSPCYGYSAVNLIRAMQQWDACDSCFADVRVQLQLHKYIWDPNQRGV